MNIEIAKSWQKDRYKIRIGDIEGCTESSQITKEELIEEIKNAIEELSEE